MCAVRICLGMQVMSIEFARNAPDCGRNSTEFDPNTPIRYRALENQQNITKGGTMRLAHILALS